MLSVAEAQHIVLQHAKPLTPEIAPLSTSSMNLVIAEDVVSDLDMPPWNKSMMDGYAVRSEDLQTGEATLTIVEEITAGTTPTKSIASGQSARIMTGAPIPDGADAVVMIEKTETTGDNKVVIRDTVDSRQHILPRGREMKDGEIVLKSGARLRPQEFGLLSAVGKTAVMVHPAPVAAILPTGDEIVEAYLKPGPGQIRNSNGPMLLAQVTRANGVPRFLGIAPDNRPGLEKLIHEGLEANVLILSGGVSVGTKDLVPQVLESAGVTPQFHRVKMKPGKPIYFGAKGDTLVFGLPGNPVSSLACFELFVRPALRRQQNVEPALPPIYSATLTNDFQYRSNRPTYFPADIAWKGSRCEVKTTSWFGSADLRGLTKANGFAVVEPGEHNLTAGTTINVQPFDYV